MLKLSIVVPAHNECDSLPEMVPHLYRTLVSHHIDHEIIVVNDNSDDNTESVLIELQKKIPTLTYYNNVKGLNGYGYAVRYGLDRFSGDCVAIMMADLSDDPDDLVKFFRKMLEGYDCVFGSRFMKGGKTVNYPKLKFILNRFANWVVRIVFNYSFNDTTNAFKLYNRDAIEGLKPLLSPHFNLTLELPLKAIIRGYSYAVVPNSWTNRKHGASNLNIKEMGSRYLFIMLYCLIEKYFSRGDFYHDKARLSEQAGEEIRNSTPTSDKDKRVVEKL